MSALNFPDNPADVGNVYVGDNGVTYDYVDGKWRGRTAAGTGGSGNGWQLTSSTAVVSLNSDGSLTLPGSSTGDYSGPGVIDYTTSSSLRIGSNQTGIGFRGSNIRHAIAIGNGAQDTNSTAGNYSIVIGSGDDTGYEAKDYSVVIGSGAGWFDYSPVGLHSIAIGHKANYARGHDNSITLNATGQDLSVDHSGFFVKPVREDNTSTAKTIFYNTATGELTYSVSQQGNANTGDIRFTSATIYEKDLGPITIKTTADTGHWWSEYGDLQYDAQDDWGSSVEYDSQGNIYIVGGTYHNLGNTSSNIQCLLIKYGPTGELLWQKTLDETQQYPYTRGEGLWIDRADNLFVLAANDNNNYSYLVKLDTSGSIVWQVMIDPSPDNAIQPIDIDGDNEGQVYIVGVRNYTVGNSRTQPWVACFNTADGTCVWQQHLNDPTAYDWCQYAYGIGVGGGNLYVTGQIIDPSVDYAWNSIIVSMNPADLGTINWSNIITSYSDRNNDVAVDSTGAPYTIGGSNGGSLLTKFDTAGNIVWQQQIDMYGSTYGTSLDFDAADNVYITCQTYNTPNTNFWGAFAVIKFDSLGNLIWQRSFGNGNNSTYTWYYDGHKEIAINTVTNAMAITGYTYAGSTSTNANLNNSNMITAQLPLDGSLTGVYGAFSYQPTTFPVSTATFVSTTATFETVATTYALTSATLVVTDNDEGADLYAFRSDSWKFDNNGVLTLPAGGTIIDPSTGDSVLNKLRYGSHYAEMNSSGVVVDETGRSLTGEFLGSITPGHNWSGIPLQIRHATGYVQLINIDSPQPWLNFDAIATQVGVANGQWITGMIVEFQAFANGQINPPYNWQNSYMTGQIVIAHSGNGYMSITHTEAGISNGNGSASDIAWTGLDLWIKDFGNGPQIMAARTDGATMQQLDIQWTARVFTNPAEYFC